MDIGGIAGPSREKLRENERVGFATFVMPYGPPGALRL
ncbi:hypothetical protein MGWOODY_Smn3599 [hydrothermal vent metagenome]|uniref:Uncharacterized protein n=1 Tax=hydrothermal vent metagenome TaxID=652676 RepID=A0A160TEW6_9ZZZZ